MVHLSNRESAGVNCIGKPSSTNFLNPPSGDLSQNAERTSGVQTAGWPRRRRIAEDAIEFPSELTAARAFSNWL